MTEIEKMAVKHDYYCSESNYYSREPSQKFETMTEFLDCMEDADIDMNLVFRWDIKNRSDDDEGIKVGRYYAEVFIIMQRKGIFKPCFISHVNEAEIPRFKAYLEKHWQTMLQIWTPVSGDYSLITRTTEKSNDPHPSNHKRRTQQA